jgi:acetylglutamate kinase
MGSGVVQGGMTPKTECCIRALAQGVKAAHIIDGRVPHALLLEVFSDAGIGTMVVGSQRHLDAGNSDAGNSGDA